MILTYADFEILIAEIKQDLFDIQEIKLKNEKAYKRLTIGGDEFLDLAALGYTIHNLYGLMENCLYRIAKAFENNLNPASWHKDLLNRMKLKIEKIRPNVLSEQTYLNLDELRGFRHVFRNQYNRGLDIKKVMILQKKINKSVELFRTDLLTFIDYLDKVKKNL